MWIWLVLGLCVHDKKADAKISQVREKEEPELNVQGGKPRWCKSCVMKYMRRFDQNSLSKMFVDVITMYIRHYSMTQHIRDCLQCPVFWPVRTHRLEIFACRQVPAIKSTHKGHRSHTRCSPRVIPPSLKTDGGAAYVYVTKASSMW